MTDIKALAELLKAHKMMLATAESCTGGLVAKYCTDLAGSSVWFDRGFVTYSNQSKTDMLGVDKTLIRQHGAVSKQVAEAMVKGAVKHSQASCAIAITGIAGPTGGTKDKPVGTVWIACSNPKQIYSQCYHFSGTREEVREQATNMAIQNLIKYITAKY